jgi:hypothetical protein
MSKFQKPNNSECYIHHRENPLESNVYLLIYLHLVCLMTLVAHCIASDGMIGQLVNNEWERMWKEAVMAELEALPWDLPGGGGLTSDGKTPRTSPTRNRSTIRTLDFMGVWIILDDYGLAGRDVV